MPAVQVPYQQGQFEQIQTIIMKLQIASIALVLSIACLSADAYAPASLISRPSTAFLSTGRIPKTTTSTQLFSQWDEEEEEDVAISTSPSFEDADKALGEEEDQAALDERGDDYDASSNVSTLIFHNVCILLWFSTIFVASHQAHSCLLFLSNLSFRIFFTFSGILMANMLLLPYPIL